MLNNPEGSRSNMLVFLKPALLACGIGLSTLFGLIQTSTIALTSNAQEEEGLSGILAPAPPEGLWEEDFLVLGDTWEEWSLGAAEDVMKLFTEEPTTIEQQREALAAVNDRLEIMKLALDDEAYALIHKPLAQLYGKLKPRYDLAKAILDTLQMDPAQSKKDQLSVAQEEISVQLVAATDYLKQFEGGEAWGDYLGLSDASSALSAAAQPKQVLAAVNPVARKINQRNKLEDEAQQEFLGREPFQKITAAVKAYRGTNNIKVNVIAVDDLREDLANLVAALDQYDETLASADAKAVKAALDAVNQHAPDGGAAIDAVMRAHYFNYNFHFVAHEDFLDQVIREQRTDRGPVRDCILGAFVTGRQTTNSTVGLDVKSSEDTIRFDVVVNGKVRSNTSGRTSQATVYTHGTHYFTARKEITFDGDQFATSPSRISVNANNNTYDASTKLDGIPLLSALGRSIALSEAAKKRPQSEAIARYKVAHRVKPEFDEEVDKQFADATENFENEFFKGLRNKDLYPSARNLKSSETHILIDTRTMGAGEMGGGRPLNVEYTGPGASVDLHETAVNNTFARMDVGGKTMTEEELSDYIRTFLNEAFNVQWGEDEKEESYDDSGSDTAAFVFSKVDPLRIRFRNDEATLILTAGLKQEGEDDIPTQEISVPLTFTLDGDKVILEPGNAGVSPVEKPESFQVQIARAGIMRKKIADAVGRQEFDANLTLNEDNDDPNDDKIVTIRELSFLNGWARIVLE
jgi:hypothetical protein